MVPSPSRTFAGLALALVASLLAARPAGAAPRAPGVSLVDYLGGRDDLSAAQRKAWDKVIRLRFGGAALQEETDVRTEIGVAKAVLAAAIAMGVEPKAGADAAWDAWHGALGFVPPPIAIHYQLLVLQGRRPRGRPIDLAFKFPEYYVEEIAPELVAWWEASLAAGKVPDDALRETQEALEATRLKMRPLLLDKLRLMARLGRELPVARGARKAELESDLDALEGELTRAFTRVARRPEVLDKKKRPFDRLRIQLEDMGLAPTEEDKLLDPDAPPPPPRPVPKLIEPELPPPEDGEPLVEPAGPPPPVLPDQPRPGDPQPPADPKPGRGLAALLGAYAQQLETFVAPWLGTPYRFGGTAPQSGTDCSGFTQGVYREAFALALPRVSADQARAGASVPRHDLRPGDLVFFDLLDRGKVSHVGIFVGGDRFVHASSSAGVKYDDLSLKVYVRAYRGARRVLAYPR